MGPGHARIGLCLGKGRTTALHGVLGVRHAHFRADEAKDQAAVCWSTQGLCRQCQPPGRPRPEGLRRNRPLAALLGLSISGYRLHLAPCHRSIPTATRSAQAMQRLLKDSAHSPSAQEATLTKAAGIVQTIGNTPHIRVNRLFGATHQVCIESERPFLCGSDLRSPRISLTLHPGNACFHRLHASFEWSFRGCRRLRSHAEHGVVPETSISRWRVPMPRSAVTFSTDAVAPTAIAAARSRICARPSDHSDSSPQSRHAA